MIAFIVMWCPSKIVMVLLQHMEVLLVLSHENSDLFSLGEISIACEVWSDFGTPYDNSVLLG